MTAVLARPDLPVFDRDHSARRGRDHFAKTDFLGTSLLGQLCHFLAGTTLLGEVGTTLLREIFLGPLY